MPPKQYYMMLAAHRVGPLRLEQMLEHRVNFDTPIWTQGMSDWLPASDVPEIAAMLPPPPPPPPPPPHLPEPSPQAAPQSRRPMRSLQCDSGRSSTSTASTDDIQSMFPFWTRLLTWFLIGAAIGAVVGTLPGKVDINSTQLSTTQKRTIPTGLALFVCLATSGRSRNLAVRYGCSIGLVIGFAVCAANKPPDPPPPAHTPGFLQHFNSIYPGDASP